MYIPVNVSQVRMFLRKRATRLEEHLDDVRWEFLNFSVKRRRASVRLSSVALRKQP